MKTTIKKTLFRVAFSLSVLWPGLMAFGASGLHGQPVQVPATANWAVHFDFQAFGETRLGEALEARPKSEHEKKHLEMARSVLGFDFEKDLHAVTLYGPDKVREHAVLVARGNFTPTLVLSYLIQRSNFTTTGYRDYQIYEWGKDKGEVLFALPGAIAFHPSGKAVLAASPAGVVEALDLIDGQLAAIEVPHPVDAANPYFVAFGNLKALGELRPEAALLRQSSHLMVAVGETDDQIGARLTLKADSLEAARQIEAVVQGIQAYALLRSTSDWGGLPDWLLTGTVVREEATLHFFLDAPTGRILKAIESRLGIK